MQPFRIYNCQLCGWINLPPPADINSPREPATSRDNSLCNIGIHTELRLLALPILVRGMFKKHGQFASFGGFRGNSDQYLLETTAAAIHTVSVLGVFVLRTVSTSEVSCSPHDRAWRQGPSLLLAKTKQKGGIRAKHGVPGTLLIGYLGQKVGAWHV